MQVFLICGSSEMFLFSYSGLANSASRGFLARILYSCVCSGKLLFRRSIDLKVKLVKMRSPVE